MKKTVIALAALASSGMACAQSSVTLFGIVDAVLAHGKGSISNRTGVDNSGYNSARLGFRGNEDLGGGLYAGFHLEGAVNNDNGTGATTNVNNQGNGTNPTCAVTTTTTTTTTTTPPAAGTTVSSASTSTSACTVAANGSQGFVFGRKIHVQLGGPWGEVRLGRDYTPIYPNQSQYDPFGTNGTGTSQVRSNLGGTTNVRASNSIGYFLPRDLGGLFGQAMYFLGENASNAANKNDGKGWGVRVGYGTGPWQVAVATQRSSFLAGDVTSHNIGGSFNAGFAVFRGMWESDKVERGARGKGYVIGFNAPVGPHEIRASYGVYDRNTAGNPKAAKLSLGYVHNLSKRTLLYTTIAQLRNSGGSAMSLNGAVTAANKPSTGFDLGIMHSF